MTTNWTRIGRGSLWRMVGVLLILSMVIALFIAAPMAQLGGPVFGAPFPFYVGYLGGVAVVFILFAPLMLPRASRPVFVDPTRTLVRVGWQTVPASRITHAYRLPDGQFDGRFQLKLAIPGLDPLIGVSSKAPAELSTADFDALLEVLAHAPIEADPRVPMRPPLGDELGIRDEAQRFDDGFAEELLAFQTVSFAKPTLLVEVRAVRDGLAGTPVSSSSAMLRDVGLVAPGTTNATGRAHAIAAAGDATGPKRGFFALQSSTYRGRLGEVEQWLGSAGFALDTRPRPRWWLGLALIIFGFLSPWLGGASLALPILFGSTLVTLPTAMGFIAFFVLAWPFIVWPGFVLMWSGRVERFQRTRLAAIEARRRRLVIPDSVTSFFGPGFPEVGIAGALFWLLASESMILLAGGITSVAMGVGQVENWEALPLGVPVGVVMIVASVFVFAWLVRVIRDAPVRQLRAVTFWRAISSPLD